MMCSSRLLSLLSIFLITFLTLTHGEKGFPPFKNSEQLHPWYHPHERSYKMPPFSLWVGTAMHDGVPFLFTNRNTYQQAIFCLHPKAGSTIIKFLLRYAMLKRKEEVTLTEILHQSPHSWQTGRTPEIKQAFEKRHVPRIIITRNPYLRLLSGYIEKIITSKQLSFGPSDLKPDDNFETFIEKLTKSQIEPEKIHFNNHFKLMSKNCLLSDGMSYDYYLPLEQMDFWYEALADALDLQAFAAKGWNLTTPMYHAPPNQDCFYRSFNRSCDQMFQKNLTAIPSHITEKSDQVTSYNARYLVQYHDYYKHLMRKMLRREDFTGNRTLHFTGSLHQAAKYYNTPSVIEKATAFVMPDLVEYNYPIWTPNMTAAQYLEMIYFDMPLEIFQRNIK